MMAPCRRGSQIHATNCQKTYLVQVEGAPTDADPGPAAARRDAERWPHAACSGAVDRTPALWERDPPVRFRKAVPDQWIEITIHEGRNRQVRRMTAHIGFPTLRLVRWRIGYWTLDGLAPGGWRDAALL